MAESQHHCVPRGGELQLRICGATVATLAGLYEWCTRSTKNLLQ